MPSASEARRDRLAQLQAARADAGPAMRAGEIGATAWGSQRPLARQGTEMSSCVPPRREAVPAKTQGGELPCSFDREDRGMFFLSSPITAGRRNLHPDCCGSRDVPTDGLHI